MGKDRQCETGSKEQRRIKRESSRDTEREKVWEVRITLDEVEEIPPAFGVKNFDK